MCASATFRPLLLPRPPAPPLIYCSGKHIPSLSAQRLQHGRDPRSLFSGLAHTVTQTRAHTHARAHTRTQPTHTCAFQHANMPNHVSVRAGEKKTTKTEQTLHRQVPPNPHWGLKGLGEGCVWREQQGASDLKTTPLASLISANVLEIKGEAVGQNAGEIRRDEEARGRRGGDSDV